MPKITDLTSETTPAANDVLAIVDVASGTTKKISRSDLLIGSPLPVDSVGTAAIQDEAVTAEKVSTGAIYLGRTVKNTNFTTTSTSYTQVTGLSCTATVPSGGRSVEITASIPLMYGSSAGSTVYLGIWKGTVGSGTLLKGFAYRVPAVEYGTGVTVLATDVAPSAGSVTYNVGAKTTTGTATYAMDFEGGGELKVKLT